MRGGSSLLIILGIALVLISYSMDTTVYGAGIGDTYNLGLLQRQMMLLQTGLAAFVAGAILAGNGTLQDETTEDTKTQDIEVATDANLERRELKRQAAQRLNRNIGWGLLVAVLLLVAAGVIVANLS